MQQLLRHIFRISEWLVAGLIFAIILFSFIEFIDVLIDHVRRGTLLTTYKELLSEAILLAVGLELILLILRHDVFIVLEILVLALSRKLILFSNSIDMLIAVFAILILLIFKWYKVRWDRTQASNGFTNDA